MDVYGMSAPDYFPIDDLLDFSNNTHLFSSSTPTDFDPHFPLNNSFNPNNPMPFNTNQISNNDFSFSHDLCIPSNDVAELEWLSNFVDESLMHFPTNELAGIVNHGAQTSSYDGRSRSKRLRESSMAGKKRESSEVGRQGRRCTHCASEKTPQWRSGPLGPKTLCNACGVRYKSGRLVPEYRPAASPTFVLTQHSNSHRKVMELRRQKEILREHCHHQQQKKFEVC